MSARALWIASVTACLSSLALGQQAKLEGDVVDERSNPAPNVRVVAPGGQVAVTDSRGHFMITFPGSVSPGQATRIDIEKPGWVVYEPFLGNCVVQSSARNYEPLKVVIVPKGSPLALGPKRLSQVVRQWADERVKLLSQVADAQRQLDEYAFLRSYSEKYGFTLDQFQAAAKQWAETKESDDKEEQALKEYYLKNYDRAVKLAHESGIDARREVKQANQAKRDASVKLIRRYQLEGDALFAQSKFREALAVYKEIDGLFVSRSLSKEDLRREWAASKLLLGDTRTELGIRTGGREEDGMLLSDAIRDFHDGLTIYTREGSPEEWAVVQSDLGVALASLGERVSGEESASLLKQAADACSQALTVLTRENFPGEWALAQSNLGNALRSLGERVSGEESLRLLAGAAAAYRQALTVLTMEGSPKEWSMVQSNLGTTLSAQAERIGPGSGQLLEQAVEAYRSALRVQTRDKFPQDWAATQNNLCSTLAFQGELTDGQKGEALLTQAVDACRLALSGTVRDQSPQQWASIQVSLGNALRMHGERLSTDEGLQLLAQAVDAFRQALAVYSQQEFPQQWAAIQMNLGNALQSQAGRITGTEGMKLLGQAVAVYRLALTVRTREHFPQDWAVTQINLGVVLRSEGERLSGDEGTRLLREALDAFRDAQTVFTREQFPMRWVIIQNGMGKTCWQLNAWPETVQSYLNVLSVSPDIEEAYSRVNVIYQSITFSFTEAFELNKVWVARHPDDLSAQADFVERHFTTSRFSEFEDRLGELLQKDGIQPRIKVVLQTIGIANLLALGRPREAAVRLDGVIEEVGRQPSDFKIQWDLAGSKHFADQAEKLAKYRTLLDELFESVGPNRSRDAILASLRRVRARLQEIQSVSIEIGGR